MSRRAHRGTRRLGQGAGRRFRVGNRWGFAGIRAGCARPACTVARPCTGGPVVARPRDRRGQSGRFETSDCRTNRVDSTRAFHTSIPHDHFTRAFHTSIPHEHFTRAFHTSISHEHSTRAFHTSISHEHFTRAFHTSISHEHFTRAFHTSRPFHSMPCMDVHSSVRVAVRVVVDLWSWQEKRGRE